MKPLKDMSVEELREEQKEFMDFPSVVSGVGMQAFDEVVRRLEEQEKMFRSSLDLLQEHLDPKTEFKSYGGIQAWHEDYLERVKMFLSALPEEHK